MKYLYDDINPISIHESYDTPNGDYESYNSLEESKLPTKSRNNLPDSEFGIPEERKYPLNDKAHVKAAIRMFNKCEEKYEKELAKNIIKKIKEYDMLDEISVSKDNRFYSYFTKAFPSKIKESTEINGFFNNLDQPIEEVNAYKVTKALSGFPIQAVGINIKSKADINKIIADANSKKEALEKLKKLRPRLKSGTTYRKNAGNILPKNISPNYKFKSAVYDNLLEYLDKKIAELEESSLSRYDTHEIQSLNEGFFGLTDDGKNIKRKLSEIVSLYREKMALDSHSLSTDTNKYFPLIRKEIEKSFRLQAMHVSKIAKYEAPIIVGGTIATEIKSVGMHQSYTMVINNKIYTMLLAYTYEMSAGLMIHGFKETKSTIIPMDIIKYACKIVDGNAGLSIFKRSMMLNQLGEAGTTNQFSTINKIVDYTNSHNFNIEAYPSRIAPYIDFKERR